MSDQRIAAARERLQRALLEGTPTDAHRSALERLERDQDAAAARQAADAAAAADARETAAHERSQQLAAAARERIAQSLSRFHTEFFAR